MENSSNKPDTGTWNSIDDALETLYSLSRVTRGSGPKSGGYSISDPSAGSSRTEYSPNSCPNLNTSRNASKSGVENPSKTYLNQNLSQNASTSDDGMTDGTSFFGGGRGKFLQELQKKYERQKLDETIHNELKVLFGPGNSNEAIEKHFGSVCSSSSEPSTQGTSRPRPFPENIRTIPRPYKEENQQGIEIVVGESMIMKKITAHEKYSAMKKKSPRCRNAILLSLAQNKTSDETKQDTKMVHELKGPDLFLPNKSYSTVVSPARPSSSKQADEPVFDDEDFPAL